MCYLVTIGARELRGNVEVLLGRDQLLVGRPSTNSSLRSVFPHEDQLFELTSGYCSCDLVIAGAHPSVEDRLARLRARYEKKGWSQAKIARAIADCQFAQERLLQSSAAPKEQLVALLRTLASTPGGVRVFVHFYSGQFGSEEMRTRGQVTVAADRLLSVSVIPEDTLTENRACWRWLTTPLQPTSGAGMLGTSETIVRPLRLSSSVRAR